jgi:hypothetical protein
MYDQSALKCSRPVAASRPLPFIVLAAAIPHKPVSLLDVTLTALVVLQLLSAFGLPIAVGAAFALPLKFNSKVNDTKMNDIIFIFT